MMSPAFRMRSRKTRVWSISLEGSRDTPLRIAARQGRAEICKTLLEHKTDPNDWENGNGYPISTMPSSILRLSGFCSTPRLT